jgi:hypothetical protein
MIAAAARQARGLNHGWIGPEHYLLALFDQRSVATEVLDDLGVTDDRLRERLALPPEGRDGGDELPPSYEPGKGLIPNPAAIKVDARAEGFAYASGHRTPGPEHYLLSMMYDDLTVASLLHHHFDVTQDAVLDGLRRRGIAVPDVPPPRFRPWRDGRGVEVTEAELKPLIDLLLDRHRPGSGPRWGFNWVQAGSGEPVRARVDAEDGIDLDGLLAEARRRLDA